MVIKPNLDKMTGQSNIHLPKHTRHAIWATTWASKYQTYVAVPVSVENCMICCSTESRISGHIRLCKLEKSASAAKHARHWSSHTEHWTCSSGAGTSLYGKSIQRASQMVVMVSLSSSWKPLIHSLMDKRHKGFFKHRSGLSPWGNTPLSVPSFTVLITSCFQLTICCSWEMGHIYTIFLFCIFFTVLILMPWKWPLCILVSQGSD
jgi:hypothetical protein